MEDKKIKLGRQIIQGQFYFVEEMSDEKVLGLLRELGWIWKEQMQAWKNNDDGFVTVVKVLRMNNEKRKS